MRIAIVSEASSGEGITILLDACTRLDEVFLRSHPRTPRLYASGVCYSREREDHGEHFEERFLTIPMCLQWRGRDGHCSQGAGDCDDLACWRAAELRVSGEDSGARAEPLRRTGGWHVIVRRSDGAAEDPSRILGMKGGP